MTAQNLNVDEPLCKCIVHFLHEEKCFEIHFDLEKMVQFFIYSSEEVEGFVHGFVFLFPHMLLKFQRNTLHLLKI